MDEITETAPTPSDLKWWHLTAPGEDYCAAVQRKEGKISFWSHKKLCGDKPSNTLTAQDKFKHWSECRKLSFRECKRLGSFPDDYRAKSDKIGKYMIGMSVPPKMAAYVAHEVCRQWLGVA
jgi:site-specific DNA-cytosine methylase